MTQPLRPFVLCAILLLCQCSSEERKVQSVEEGAAESQPVEKELTATGEFDGDYVIRQLSRFKDAPIEKQRAEIFDRFLNDDLNKHDLVILKESCDHPQSTNPYCYSINNRDRLREKVRAAKQRRTRRVRFRPAKPKFANDDVSNWETLKSSNVNALLRGLSSLRTKQQNLVRSKAAKDKSCPNNVGAALAATLEDDLPNRITADEIAQLYERTGSCENNTAQDRETLLTRGGLFYFVAKKYELARDMFQKASNVSDYAYTGRALYWLYRTQTLLGQTEKAKETLEVMKTKYPFSFHTLFAVMTMKGDPGDILARSQITKVKRSQRSTVVNNLLEVVELLRGGGYTLSASRVLDWSVAEGETLEPELKIYMAELAEEGDQLAKISILSDVLYKNPKLVSKETMDLYFPKVFFPVFEKNSSGIDPFFLLAVARQESAFNPNAVSSANARGLLQVLPSTAKKLNHNKTANLWDPELNVKLGARYLLDLLLRTKGQIHYALAAYNAGEKRLNTWTERYPTAEPILFIDLIPYRETREYISSILRNYYWYRRIHQSDSPMLAQKLFEADLTRPE